MWLGRKKSASPQPRESRVNALIVEGSINALIVEGSVNALIVEGSINALIVVGWSCQTTAGQHSSMRLSGNGFRYRHWQPTTRPRRSSLSYEYPLPDYAPSLPTLNSLWVLPPFINHQCLRVQPLLEKASWVSLTAWVDQLTPAPQIPVRLVGYCLYVDLFIQTVISIINF